MADEDVLSSPKSERVRKVAALATAKGRRRQGLFMAEGPQPVREALASWLAVHEEGQPRRPWTPQLDALYFEPDALERHPDVQTLLDRVRGVLFDPQADLAPQARIFLREATPEVLTAMSDAETSQGVIAVCRIPQEQDLPAEPSLVAGLLRVQDPGNAGSIIRAADAAGADAVALTPGSVDPWAPKVVRSAAGSHFHLPLVTGQEAEQLAAAGKEKGLQVLAADAGGEASLKDLGGTPALWLFGNEAHGLSSQERELSDVVVSIPIYGQAESLNVGTAAAICLYTSAMAQH